MRSNNSVRRDADVRYAQLEADARVPGRRSLFRIIRSLSTFQKQVLALLFIFCALGAILAFKNLRVTYDNRHDSQPPSLTKSEVTRVDQPQLEQKQVVPKPRTFRFSGPENEHQTAIVEEFRHAWESYKSKAWGYDLLKPISGGHEHWYGIGLTILDSLDTLLIMGMAEEFDEAKGWVENQLSFDQHQYVNLFETTIRCLGGLLSAYFLSGETVFLRKAQDLGDRLVGAFSSPSGIPYSDVELITRKGKSPAWSVESSLSEVSSIQLEFRALSRATGNPVYESLAFNVSRRIHASNGCEKPPGLCGMFINPKTATFRRGTTITFGARVDSYYEYLLKQWLQTAAAWDGFWRSTGKSIDWLKDDYLRAMSSMKEHLYRYSKPNNYGFVGELQRDKFSPKMDHLVCFLAGTLALGTANGLPPEHMDIAKELGHTCYRMYETASGLAPEIAHFNMMPSAGGDIIIKPLDSHSLLRPEAVESWYYLYALTGDRIYQDWGWKVFTSMRANARVRHGYASVTNVKKLPTVKRDSMESFFLAETMKYLYLLMGNNTIHEIPLTEFVFNTEAHPLPIYES